MLRYSEDQGQTWSSERWATVGALGHFSTRPQWHRLGSSRARVYEMAGTDPVRIVIDNLQLDVTAAVR
jgi:hypothetical protein